MADYKSRQTAASKLTSMVFLSLFMAVFFCAYRIIPFYYYFFELQNQMQQSLSLADSSSDQEIRKKIERHIRELDIPVQPSKLKIARIGNKIMANLEYSEIFYVRLWGKDYDLKEFRFNAYAEHAISN